MRCSYVLLLYSKNIKQGAFLDNFSREILFEVTMNVLTSKFHSHTPKFQSARVHFIKFRLRISKI